MQTFFLIIILSVNAKYSINNFCTQIEELLSSYFHTNLPIYEPNQVFVVLNIAVFAFPLASVSIACEANITKGEERG